MNILGITINRNLIIEVVISMTLGWIVGLIISHINVFGSSDKAPLICSMASGISAFERLKRKQNSNL